MSTPTGAHCPHCGVEYIAELCDQEGLVSYWGEGEPTGVYCLGCDKDFKIREHVLRTWETVAPGCPTEEEEER